MVGDGKFMVVRMVDKDERKGQWIVPSSSYTTTICITVGAGGGSSTGIYIERFDSLFIGKKRSS